MSALMPLLTRYSKVFLFIAVAFTLVLLIRWVKRLLRRQSKKKEIDRAASDRLRDENLNQIILNNHTGGVENREIYKPYDVDYNGEGSGGLDNMNVKAGQTMIQLVEHTRLSTRKYVLNPAKKSVLGAICRVTRFRWWRRKSRRISVKFLQHRGRFTSGIQEEARRQS